MIPLRIDAAAVEPVSVADLRAYLRFDSDDDGVEDELLQALITAVRASLKLRRAGSSSRAATGSRSLPGRPTGRCRCR
ncbi:MAG: phage gp6-like head-tail connector protein [Hyphomicrobiales bacterium]|jgi:uncharacterized phiE125 gp8 family phage protein